jgi:hypothetical protein
MIHVTTKASTGNWASRSTRGPAATGPRRCVGHRRVRHVESKCRRDHYLERGLTQLVRSGRFSADPGGVHCRTGGVCPNRGTHGYRVALAVRRAGHSRAHPPLRVPSSCRGAFAIATRLCGRVPARGFVRATPARRPGHGPPGLRFVRNAEPVSPRRRLTAALSRRAVPLSRRAFTAWRRAVRHADYSTTLKVYAHLDPERAKAAAGRIDAALGRAPEASETAV